MNAKIIDTLVVLLFISIIGYLIYSLLPVLPVGEDQNGNTNGSQEPAQLLFEETGNLVRGNPGMEADVWYLIYEKPGAPALQAELAFEEDMNCLDAQEFLVCGQQALKVGDRVLVKGDEENDVVQVQEISFAPDVDTATVNLYYYNEDKDKDESGNIQCSRDGIEAVQRTIAQTQTPIQDTIELLLQGVLTEEEKDMGISTEYPLPGLTLEGASLRNGALTLEFSDSQNRTGGGSCRVGILWFQIEATANQFGEVETTRFIPEELFQP